MNGNSSDLIYVGSYTREDGTQVDDYYRHRAGRGSFAPETSSRSGIGSINVPDTVSSVLSIVGSKKDFEQECPALTKLFGSVSNATTYPTTVIKGGVEVFRVALKKVIGVAVKVLDVALPAVGAIITAYHTGKTIYNKATGLFSSQEAQVQYRTVQTTIQGLRETQNLQKKNIDNLAKKLANTQNKDEYSNLFRELAKQKNEYQKNETLICKIEYSFNNHDYESLHKGLVDYQQNLNITSEEATESKNNSTFEYPRQELTHKFENAYNGFGNNSAKTFNIEELESLQNRQLGSLPNNSILKEFLNQNNQMQGTTGFDEVQQSFLPEEVNQMFEATIGKNNFDNPIPTFLHDFNGERFNEAIMSKMPPIARMYNGLSKESLKIINDYLNRNRKDARDFMDIGLKGPKNVPNTKEWMFISSRLTPKVNGALGLKGNQQIPFYWDGFVFSEDSSVAKSIVESKEFKDYIYSFSNNKPVSPSLNFTSTKNLHYSIGHGTIINPKIDIQGNFTGVLFDKYDYDLLIDDYLNNPEVITLNNLAWGLQLTKNIKNFYILIPIKLKL